MCFKEAGKVIEIKSTHPSKAFSSMQVTPSGITISLMSSGESPKVPLRIMVLFVYTFTSFIMVMLFVSLPIFNPIFV